jgi:hypothetical protein
MLDRSKIARKLAEKTTRVGQRNRRDRSGRQSRRFDATVKQVSDKLGGVGLSDADGLDRVAKPSKASPEVMVGRQHQGQAARKDVSGNPSRQSLGLVNQQWVTSGNWGTRLVLPEVHVARASPAVSQHQHASGLAAPAISNQLQSLAREDSAAAWIVFGLDRQLGALVPRQFTERVAPQIKLGPGRTNRIRVST